MLVVIARGVASLLHVQFIACALLGIVARHVALALLAHHVADKPLLALEVVADGVGLVGRLPVLEDRHTLHHAQRVFHAMGIDRAAVQVHGDDLGGQFDVLVGIVHLAVAIEVGVSVLGKDDGVVRLISDRSIQPILLLGHRIRLQRVGNQRISGQRIAQLHCRLCTSPLQSPLPATTLRISLSGDEQQQEEQYNGYGYICFQ